MKQVFYYAQRGAPKSIIMAGIFRLIELEAITVQFVASPFVKSLPFFQQLTRGDLPDRWLYVRYPLFLCGRSSSYLPRTRTATR